MNKQKRDELRELEAKATPGPWGVHIVEETQATYHFVMPSGCGEAVADTGRQADSAFIVAARNAMPLLLDRIDDLEKSLADILEADDDVEAVLDSQPDNPRWHDLERARVAYAAAKKRAEAVLEKTRCGQ